MNHDARLDRLEKKNPPDRLPKLYEFREEIDRMKADPSYVCKWSQEQVHAWTEQMKEMVAEPRPWST